MNTLDALPKDVQVIVHSGRQIAGAGWFVMHGPPDRHGTAAAAIKQDLLMNVVWSHRSQFFVAIQFRWQGCNFFCGSIYLPTAGRPMDTYEARPAEVEEIIHQPRDIDYFIIDGDFNFVGGSWMADGYTWGQWRPPDREPHQRAVAVSGWAQHINLKESTTWHARKSNTPDDPQRSARTELECVGLPLREPRLGNQVDPHPLRRRRALRL